jgi:precorrin-2 dehydrogenase/sirohydrochlorin ferrochelatase
MYPISLNIAGKICVVVGGGQVAARKVDGILGAGARVRIISPDLTDRLQALAEQGEVEWRQKRFEAEDLRDAFLVFAATDNPQVQALIVKTAREENLLVNVADGPDLCDFQIPAVLRRGDLTITVATNGTTPAVAVMVKKRLETLIGEEYGALTALVAAFRDEIICRATCEAEKKILFQKILQDDILRWLRERQWAELQQHLESVIGRPLGLDLEVLFKENP